jgi:hypothetical protein
VDVLLGLLCTVMDDLDAAQARAAVWPGAWAAAVSEPTAVMVQETGVVVIGVSAIAGGGRWKAQRSQGVDSPGVSTPCDQRLDRHRA